MANPSQLDSGQILQGAYDDTNQCLRVEQINIINKTPLLMKICIILESLIILGLLIK